MIRFLIIDDEDIIRRGIRNKILKLIEGAEIVGEAIDGEEALAMTEQLQPDIVITDIKMPKVDGLLYIENSLKFSPNTHFIVVSGYQDFSYAHKALKLGVSDYLLKPIEDEDLKKAVDTLIERINTKKTHQQYLTGLKQKVSNSELLYKNNLCSKLVKDSLKDTDILDNYGDLKNAENYRVCTVRINTDNDYSNHEEEKDIVQLTANIFEENIALQFPCLSFKDENSEHSFVAIIYGSYTGDNLVTTIKKTIETIKNLLNIDLYLGLGNVYSKYENIKDSYMESQIAIMQKLIYETKKIITFEDYTQVMDNEYVLLDNKKKLLESYLKLGDFKNVVHLIENIFSDISAKKIVYSKAASLSLELMFVIINTLKISKNYEHTDLNSRRIDYFFRDCITYEDFHQIVLNRSKQVCEYMKQSEIETGKGIIQEILNRIEVEYYRNIKLIDLADEYYINPSYLSQLFLQQTRKNFKQYLSEVRLKNAKNLLCNTEIPIAKISELVGYSDRGHFSKTFIAFTGVTPAKYRSENSCKN